MSLIFFFQAEDGIRDVAVTGVQTCALPPEIVARHPAHSPQKVSARLPPCMTGHSKSVSASSGAPALPPARHAPCPLLSSAHRAAHATRRSSPAAPPRCASTRRAALTQPPAHTPPAQRHHARASRFPALRARSPPVFAAPRFGAPALLPLAFARREAAAGFRPPP